MRVYGYLLSRLISTSPPSAVLSSSCYRQKNGRVYQVGHLKKTKLNENAKMHWQQKPVLIQMCIEGKGKGRRKDGARGRSVDGGHGDVEFGGEAHIKVEHPFCSGPLQEADKEDGGDWLRRRRKKRPTDYDPCKETRLHVNMARTCLQNSPEASCWSLITYEEKTPPSIRRASISLSFFVHSKRDLGDLQRRNRGAPPRPPPPGSVWNKKIFF